MLIPTDLIHHPYTSDLTQAGIAYACRALTRADESWHAAEATRIQHIVAEIAVELTFRRLLVAQDVPHDTLITALFTNPDRHDIVLGGRRCNLKNYPIFDKREIRRLRRRPEHWLQTPALLPVDQMDVEWFGEEDVFVFAFTTALITPRRADIQRALNAGQPIYPLHILPPDWANPEHWAPLDPIVLKSEGRETIEIELGGLAATGDFLSEQISLPSLCRTQVQNTFYSLRYVHTPHIPEGRIGLSTSQTAEAYIITPYDWDNIWVYGMDVILTGYLSRREYRRRAHLLPAGSRVLRHTSTRTNNLMLPTAELRPLSDLFGRVKRWRHQTNRT